MQNYPNIYKYYNQYINEIMVRKLKQIKHKKGGVVETEKGTLIKKNVMENVDLQQLPLDNAKLTKRKQMRDIKEQK